MKAPERAGRYTAFFRMQTGHSVRFGHKVWCDIQVIEASVPVVEELIVVEAPKEEVQQPEPKIEVAVAMEPFKMSISEVFNKEDELGNSFEVEAEDLNKPLEPMPLENSYPTFEDLGDKNVSAGPVKSAPLEESKEMSQSQFLPKTKTPKETYFELVESVKTPQLKQNLADLYDFGFVDFAKNHALLLQHQNIETVAAQLLENSGN